MSQTPISEQEDQRKLLQAVVGTDYEILDRIGYGGFGVVFRATDRKLKREVAIKVLRAELFEVKTARARFHQEAQAAAKLRHPNIIPIYAVGEEAGIAYIVMPLIEGESLAAMLDREGRLSLPEARRILIEVADALHCAHEAGIVHRDIKPQNIMLEGAGRRVLLTDFGIARVATSDLGTLTGTGVVIGTPTYMSPEQATGGADVDARSDIYSLGVVGYQLLTGAPPFDGSTPQELIVRHLTELPKNPTVRRADIPTDLAAVVMRCLAKKPAKRWNSADELSLALRPRVGTPAAALDGASRQPIPLASQPATPSRTVVRNEPKDLFSKVRTFLPGLMVVGVGIYLVLRPDANEYPADQRSAIHIWDAVVTLAVAIGTLFVVVKFRTTKPPHSGNEVSNVLPKTQSPPAPTVQPVTKKSYSGLGPLVILGVVTVGVGGYILLAGGPGGSGEAGRAGAISGETPREGEGAGSGVAPTMLVDSAQLGFDRIADSVGGMVRRYGDRMKVFMANQDCVALWRALVSVEDAWTGYNVWKRRTGQPIASARAARDQTLYAAVDSVERQFDHSGCPRLDAAATSAAGVQPVREAIRPPSSRTREGLVAVPLATRTTVPAGGTAVVGVALKRGRDAVPGVLLVLRGSGRLTGRDSADAEAVTDERGIAQFRFSVGKASATANLAVATVSGEPLTSPAEIQLTPVSSLESAHLFISSTPFGQLFIDDRLMGNTPKADLQVAPGMHRIRITRDGFLPFETDIAVEGGETLRLTEIVLQKQ